MKILLTVLCFMISLSGVSGQPYNAGYTCYIHDEYTKAIAFFDQALAAKDHVAEANLYKGACYVFLKRFTEAKSALKRADSLGVSRAQLYFITGKLWLFNGRYDSAIAYYSRATEVDRNFASAYSDRGIAKALQGDFYGTIRDNTIAIAIDSLGGSYYCDRGYARIKVNDFDSAILDLTAAKRIDNSQRVNTNLGLAYFLKGQFKNSVAAYNEAILIKKNDAETLYLRALAYEKLGYPDKACADLIRSSQFGYPSSKEKILELHCE